MPYEKGQRTKEMIFSAARSVIYEYGYKKTTIQNIAQVAQVPAGLVNYYYKKYDILEKIYYDFFEAIYAHIDEVLGEEVENAIERHILLTHVIMYKIFDDKKELYLYLEVVKEGLFPDKVHDLVRQNYAAQMWSQFNLKMSFDKYYLLNFAEYGARKELLIKNSALTVSDPFFADFVDVLATVAVRLAGIDNDIIERSVQRAQEHFKRLDCRSVVFLRQ